MSSETQRIWGATVKIIQPTETQCLLAEAITKISDHVYVGVDLGVVITSHPHLVAKIDHWKVGGRGNPPRWQPPQLDHWGLNSDEERSA